MLDPKLLRTELDTVAQRLQKKGFTLDTERFQSLEEQRKVVQTETESLQSEKNNHAKSIGKAKAAGEDIAPLIAQVDELGNKLDASKKQLQAVQLQLEDLLTGIPNMPHDSVPEGKDEDDNVEVRTWGEPTSL